jgi:hypothetical protein
MPMPLGCNYSQLKTHSYMLYFNNIPLNELIHITHIFYTNITKSLPNHSFHIALNERIQHLPLFNGIPMQIITTFDQNLPFHQSQYSLQKKNPGWRNENNI